VLPSVSNPTDPGSPGPAVHEIHHETLSHDHHPKPATPADFLGDHTKGQAFLNSCTLYFALAPHQFVDEHVQVMWALSFMKGGRAACFVDRLMRNYQLTGRLPYPSYSDFTEEFANKFCPKNKIQTSWTELETVRYFQGTRTVDEYVDDFCELVERAQYFEGSHIVLKFQQGLNVKIQDHVACLTTG
jgi:Retrotransposon gag protein